MTVWVSRPEPEDGPLATALRAEGLTPVVEPVIEEVELEVDSSLLSVVKDDDWLVLTSVRAIERVEADGNPRVAVVGERSAELARARKHRVEFVAPTGVAAEIWQHLDRPDLGGRVFFPRSRQAPLPRCTSIAPIPIDLYDMQPRRFEAARALRSRLLSVTSPSAARAITAQLGSLPIPVVTLGPTSTAAVRELNGEVVAECRERSFEALASTCRLALDDQSAR